jgi:hypothetical protein
MPTNFDSQNSSQGLSSSASQTGAQSSTMSASKPQQATTAQAGAHDSKSQPAALDTLRTSVVGVLDSVVREYEPQIAEFTSNIAHQAVDRGVEFAQTTVQRVKAQSWVRIGVAAALGIGALAVLAYEAEQAATGAAGSRSDRTTH